MYPNASIHTYGLTITIKTKGELFMDHNQDLKPTTLNAVAPIATSEWEFDPCIFIKDTCLGKALTF